MDYELDLKIISLIIHNNDLILREDLDSELFLYPFNIILDLIKKIYKKYGNLPTLDILIKKLTINKVLNKYFENDVEKDKYINTVVLITDKYNDLNNFEVYLDELKLRKTKDVVKNKIIELKDVLTEYDKNLLKDKFFSIIKEIDNIDKSKNNIVYTDSHNIEIILDSIRDYYVKSYNNITTGFSLLDEETGGMTGGEMWLFAGRPGTGKSIALLNIAVNNIKKGKNVVIFSLEMPYTQYWVRFLSNYMNINTKKLYRDELNEEERIKLNLCIEELKSFKNKLTIIDAPLISVNELKIELKKIDNPLDLIIIDYIGLIKDPKQKQKPDYLVLGEVAESIRTIAREMNVPIVTASQLNRTNDKNKNKLKSTERIARSDIISATCDVIVQLDESESNKNKNNDNSEMEVLNLVEMYVAKNRKGKGFFSFNVRKNFENSRFEEAPILVLE